MRSLALVFVVLATFGCKTEPGATREPVAEDTPIDAEAVDEFGPWSAPLHRDHPLVGSAWSTAEGRVISRAELEQRLFDARFVLLGETHDNPDHHRLQGELITAMTKRSRKPAVVFEMLDPAKQTAIDEFTAAFAGNVDEFATLVAWADSGWPEWSLYRPVFAAALAAKLPILGGELSREEARLFMAEGLASIDPKLVEDFHLAEPLPAELQAAWLDEMFASHCEMVPREHLGGMVEVQRLRDARMADKMLSGQAASGQSILIAGGGHARRDWGVPRLLRASSSETEKATVSVGFIAVQPGVADPREYPLASFDVLVFTPEVEREDPCVAFKASMSK